MENMELEEEFRETYQRKTKLIIFLSLLLVLLVVLTGGMISIHAIKTQELYMTNLDQADKLFANNNYEEAIFSYQLSIQAKPKEEEPYLRLSDVYVVLGRLDDARNILEKGYKRTKADAILQKMRRLYLDVTPATEYTAEEMRQGDRDVTVNNTMFDWVSSYTYNDYVFHFGSAQITGEVDDLSAEFSGFAGKCHYFNTAENSYIVDLSRRMPYANRKPNYIQLDSMSAVLNRYPGFVTYERLYDLFGDSITIEKQGAEEKYILKLFYRGCLLEVESDEQGNVIGFSPQAKLTPLESGEGTGEASPNAGIRRGYVTNAVTGSGVRAVIKAHKENKFGTVAATVECGFDGSYELELEAGRYVLEISAPGFIQEFFDINIAEKELKENENYTLSPVLAQGEIRIVLEWGSSPMDLDSHLKGRNSSGGTVDVFYQFKQARESGNLTAELDLDDTNGYGPETTTVYDTGGSYVFSVHDYTNGGSSGSSALANSGATVKVYLPGESQPRVFTVPSGNGVWWHVFKLEQGNITEINRME